MYKNIKKDRKQNPKYQLWVLGFDGFDNNLMKQG